MSIVNKNFKSKILRDSSYPLYYSVDSSFKGIDLVRSPLSKKTKQKLFHESNDSLYEEKKIHLDESIDTNNHIDKKIILDTFQSKSKLSPIQNLQASHQYMSPFKGKMNQDQTLQNKQENQSMGKIAQGLKNQQKNNFQEDFKTLSSSFQGRNSKLNEQKLREIWQPDMTQNKNIVQEVVSFRQFQNSMKFKIKDQSHQKDIQSSQNLQQNVKSSYNKHSKKLELDSSQEMISEIQAPTNAFKSNFINKFTNDRIAEYSQNKKTKIESNQLNQLFSSSPSLNNSKVPFLKNEIDIIPITPQHMYNDNQNHLFVPQNSFKGKTNQSLHTRLTINSENTFKLQNSSKPKIYNFDEKSENASVKFTNKDKITTKYIEENDSSNIQQSIPSKKLDINKSNLIIHLPQYNEQQQKSFTPMNFTQKQKNHLNFPNINQKNQQNETFNNQNLKDSLFQQNSEFKQIPDQIFQSQQEIQNEDFNFPLLQYNNQNKINIDRAIHEGMKSGSLGINNETFKINMNFNSIFVRNRIKFKSPIQQQQMILKNAVTYNKKNQKQKNNTPLKINPKQNPQNEIQYTEQQQIINQNINNTGSNSSLSPVKIKSEFGSPDKFKESNSENQLLQSGQNNIHSKFMNQLSQKYLKNINKQIQFQDQINEEESENNSVSSAKIRKNYLIDQDFKKLLNLLENLVEKKKEYNIIDQTIREIANQNGIDENQLNGMIQKFIQKRQLLDAGQISSRGQVCLIQDRSMQFLKNTQVKNQQAESKSPQNKGSPKVQHLSSNQLCNHITTEEDNHLKYVQEYRRFIEFQHSLRMKQKSKDLPIEILIKKLMEEVNNLDNQFSAQEKKLFNSKESIRNLFENPMLYIVMSQNEIEDIIEKEDLQSAHGISPHKLMLSSKGKVLLNKSTNNMLERVGNEFIKDQNDILTLNILTQDELKQSINRRVLKNNSKIISKDRKNYSETNNEISEKSFSNLENFQPKQINEENLQQFKNSLEKQILHSIEQFRLKKIQSIQENAIKFSLFIPVLKLNEKKETQKQINEISQEKKQLSNLINEIFSDNIIKLIEKMKEQIKQNEQFNQDQILGDYQDSEEDNKSQDSNKSMDRKRRLKKLQNEDKSSIGLKQSQIYNEIQANNQFYKQAKNEIIGYNRKPNQESYFYQNCTQKGMLPQPVFKCVKNNTLQFQGKNLQMGYAMALEKYLKGITQTENFIQQIHLDDCSMKDIEFKHILKGIRKSKIGISLQNITYSNNEMGVESINEINKILKLSKQLGKARCLKQICLTNIKIKQMNDVRFLFECISENGDNLNSLKIQQMNINDNKIIESICHLMKDNKLLMQLELSSCCLQAKQLLQISEFIETTENLKVLDLSGNPLSELVEENQIKQALFLNKIIDFLNLGYCRLYSLNLQGMLLGKKLIYFVDKITKNQTLIQINFINNLLTQEDELMIKKKLQIGKKDMKYQKIIEKFDINFQQQLNKFKITHLIEDNKHFNISRKPSDVVNSIINAGIVKELRQNKNLQKKLTPFSQIGEIFGSTGSTKEYGLVSEKLDTQIDRVFLRRNIGFHEMIYNQLGQDHLYHLDFKKANKWNVIDQNPKIPSWQSDIRQHQYIIIYLDIDNMGDTFTKVKDQETILLLRKYFAFDKYERNLESEEIKSTQWLNPIVFGSFNNWKPMQTMTTQHYSSLVCASNAEEINILIDYVFDESFYEAKSEFKSIFQQSYQIVGLLAQVQNAMVIGNLPNNPKNYPSLDYKTYIYSGFVLPGKHSVFIYLPETKQFYRKLIAVEAQESFFTRQTLSSSNQIGKRPNSKHSERMKTVYEKIKFLTNLKQPQVNQSNDQNNTEYIEMLINDILPNNLQLNKVIDPVQFFNFNKLYQDMQTMINEILNCIETYFVQIITVFRELQSESQETYPFISFKNLQSFCIKYGFCSQELFEKSLITNHYQQKITNNYKNEEQNEDIHSIFDLMDRSKFINFLIWVWFQEFFSNQKSKLQFKAFIKKRLFDKLQDLENKESYILSSKLFKIKKDFEENNEIQKIIKYDQNQETFQRWIDQYSIMNSISPREIIIIFINRARVPVSQFNLTKFYSLSKKFVKFEQSEGSHKYISLDCSEFLELIYRVADHIYDQQNYQEEEIKSLQQDVQNMFEQPAHIKFINLLKQVLSIDDGADKFQVIENIDSRDDQDKYGEGMARYLSDNCAKEYLSRI